MRAATVKRGDIFYVAETETTGSEQGGNRPAIVVSNDTGNRYAPVVEVVYLTTRKKASLPTHVYIGSAERPSIALCEQIVTVSKSRIERYVGSVTAEEMRKVDKALQTSLGIHKATGGNAMQISINTPFGDMKFDMPPEKATELLQRAFQYAAGQGPEGKTPPTPPTAAQEQPKAQKPINKTGSRVEHLFGDFGSRSSDKTTDLSDAPEEIKETIVKNAEKLAQREPETYRGFLLVKCDQCGKVRGFCAKTPITSSRCDCGNRIPLRGLKPAYLKCKCGKEFKYKTNITEEQFDFPCLNCGSPVDLELNKRGNAYVTIG